MNNAVLISINPTWCCLIANGEKIIEIRKTRPKLETPFKCYIYCTQHRTNKLWILKHKYRMQFPHKISAIFQAEKVGGASVGNGKIIGEFVCNKITEFQPTTDLKQITPTLFQICEQSRVDMETLHSYADHKKLYGWHISDLIIYDEPKELSELETECSYFKNNQLSKKCYTCDYYETIAGLTGCLCCGYKPIFKAPQSWCYVTEIA